MSSIRQFVVSCGHRTLQKFRLNNETISVEYHDDGTWKWGDAKCNFPPDTLSSEQCVRRLFQSQGAFNIFVKEVTHFKKSEEEYVALGGMLF